MKQLMILLYTLGGLFTTSHLKAQVVLEALDAPNGKCLERVYDKYYGDGVHNYIYCAVQGPNGKKWLNLNLGAEYAKESSPHFNPEAQPTDYNDWKAFGNLYQWGRDSDGHEQVEYRQRSGVWEFRPINGVRTTLVGAGKTSNQMVSVTNTYYYASYDLGVTWFNDPCPEGYRVMLRDDMMGFSHLSAYGGGWYSPSIAGDILTYPDLRLVTAPVNLDNLPNAEGWIKSKTTTLTDNAFPNTGTSALWVAGLSNSIGYLQTDHTYIQDPSDPVSSPSFFDRGVFGGGQMRAFGFGTTHIYRMPASIAVRCVQK